MSSGRILLRSSICAACAKEVLPWILSLIIIFVYNNCLHLLVILCIVQYALIKHASKVYKSVTVWVCVCVCVCVCVVSLIAYTL